MVAHRWEVCVCVCVGGNRGLRKSRKIKENSEQKGTQADL